MVKRAYKYGAKKRGIKYKTKLADLATKGANLARSARSTYLQTRRGFKGSSYQSITVTKTIRLPDLVCTTLPLTETFAYYSFLPSTVPDWAAYAGLYEKFYLKKVKLVFEPKFTSNLFINSTDPNTTAISMFNNRFYTYFEDIDQTVPTTMTYFHERPKCKFSKLNRKHTRTIYPKVREDINDDILTSLYKSSNGWYSTQTVPTFYGLKVGVEEYFTSGLPLLYPLSYNVYATYTIGFKEPQ